MHILLRFVRCLSVSAFETLKAAQISHHAPLRCLWTHSIRIVKYVQCFSVVHFRQSLLDLVMSGADDVFKDRDYSCLFSSQTVTLMRKKNTPIGFNPIDFLNGNLGISDI